jgi:hypothetical protein
VKLGFWQDPEVGAQAKSKDIFSQSAKSPIAKLLK